jgi:hypothetical protein
MSEHQAAASFIYAAANQNLGAIGYRLQVDPNYRCNPMKIPPRYFPRALLPAIRNVELIS